jgi:type I restriction enzyme R subunit
LEQLIALATKVGTEESDATYPVWANNGARRALIDFGLTEEQAVAVDLAVLQNKPDSWVGNAMKERRVKRAIRQVLPEDFDRFDELFDLIKARNEYR